VISGFRRDVDEFCYLSGCYGASSGKPSPTFLDSVPVPSSRIIGLTLEDGTGTLSRNVGEGLPLDAAKLPRGAKLSA
jgi:hypothetical protein